MAVDYEAALAAVQQDPRYKANIDYGQPRSGHPEGTIKAHILTLEGNLEQIRSRLDPAVEARLRFAIHVHDTFKPEARVSEGVRDHGLLARDFAAEFIVDNDMLALLELHDEPYRLWKSCARTGTLDTQRLEHLAGRIVDWDQFLAFVILDSWTAGKSLDKLRWFIRAALAIWPGCPRSSCTRGSSARVRPQTASSARAAPVSAVSASAAASCAARARIAVEKFVPLIRARPSL